MSGLFEHRPPRVDVKITLRELCETCGCKVYGESPSEVFTGVSADSRAVVPGDVFFCLKTNSGDGHLYVRSAEDAGAAAAVVERRPEDMGDMPLLMVKDTWKALDALAVSFREKSSAKIAAVSGSNGKTTTRAFLTSILSTMGNTFSPVSNWNNRLGVCLSLISAAGSFEYLSMELGINHFGEMAHLASIVKPDAAVLTNIGPVHLEFLGDESGVARAKAELFENLKPGSTAVVNLDDPYIKEMHIPSGVQRLTYSMSSGDADVSGRVLSDKDALVLEIKSSGRSVKAVISNSRRINAVNALSAAATAIALGADLENIARGIETAVLPPLRFQKFELKNGAVLILDCYNANPASMRTAIDELAAQEKCKRRAALLGDMLELGRSAEEEHNKLGEYAASAGLDALFFVGPLSKLAAAQAEKKGGMEVFHFSSPEDAAAELKRFLRRGDVLLIKGSRGMKLENAAEILGSATEGE